MQILLADVVLDPWINKLVVGLFGVFLGAMLGIFMLIYEPFETKLHPPRRPGERLLKFAWRHQKEEPSELSAYPRSVLLATGSLYGLVAVFMIMLVFSPVEFSWWPLLLGVFVGFALVRGLYGAVEAGRLEIPRGHLDRIFWIKHRGVGSGENRGN